MKIELNLAILARNLVFNKKFRLERIIKFRNLHITINIIDLIKPSLTLQMIKVAHLPNIQSVCFSRRL